MIETKANMIKDEIIQEGIEMAKIENKKIIEFIEEIVKEIGKKKMLLQRKMIIPKSPSL